MGHLNTYNDKCLEPGRSFGISGIVVRLFASQPFEINQRYFMEITDLRQVDVVKPLTTGLVYNIVYRFLSKIDLTKCLRCRRIITIDLKKAGKT